jgi:hypothetical protein
MGRGSDRGKRGVWARRLREFERGDESVAEFCGREGVSVSSFYRWQRVLASAALQNESTSRGANASAAQARMIAAGELRFLPVEIVPSVSPPAVQNPERQTSASSSFIEVLLPGVPGGVRVLVPCDAAAAIRTVVAALVDGTREEPAC